MPSSYTPNYALSQWEADDQVQRTDFNADNAKIDAALGTLAAQVATRGNCRIETGSYAGDGSTTRAMSVTASFQPKLLIVTGNDAFAILIYGAPLVYFIKGNRFYGLNLTWAGNTVSWLPNSSIGDGSYILNGYDTTYYYAILG